jgi:hypothetical protein
MELISVVVAGFTPTSREADEGHPTVWLDGAAIFGKNRAALKNSPNFLPAPSLQIQLQMERSELETLKNQDWDTISLRLLEWTYRILRIHYGCTAMTALPCGETPEKIVDDLIRAYFQGVRRVNPAHPLEVQLRRGVRSRLWAIHRRKEAKETEPVETDETQELSDTAPTPAGETESDDACKTIFELLLAHPKVQKSEDLSLLVMAFQDGVEDEKDLATATGLTVARIYQLKRELRVIYPTIKSKLQK